MSLFYKNFFFVFFFFLFFSFSLEIHACRTPSTLKDNELTKEECQAFGGSCDGCGSGQIKLGTCTGFFGGGACGIGEEKYKKLIEEGKLPVDPFYEKPPTGTEECAKIEGAQCNQNCKSISNGYSVGTCEEGPPKIYCCKPGISGEPSINASFDYTPLEPIPGTEGMDTSTLKGFLEGLFL
ncbi:MAG: hypothetical protein EOM19_07095, partial [Candidatus Moranbacteria bacterium]|nr:hypothetical protein [Candidatus Moranbacteria bacterium]